MVLNYSIYACPVGNIISYNLRDKDVKPSRALSSPFVNTFEIISESTEPKKVVQKTSVIDEKIIERAKLLKEFALQ